MTSPARAPEPAVLRAMVEGVVGVATSEPTDCDVASESALATVEARMNEAAGGPFTISRGASQSMEVARALLERALATPLLGERMFLITDTRTRRSRGRPTSS